MAATDVSAPSVTKALCRASSMATDSALRAAGRLRVSTATPGRGRSRLSSGSSAGVAFAAVIVRSDMVGLVLPSAASLLQRLLDLGAVRLHQFDVLDVLQPRRGADRLGELLHQLLLVGVGDRGVRRHVAELLLQGLDRLGELAR